MTKTDNMIEKAVIILMVAFSLYSFNVLSSSEFTNLNQNIKNYLSSVK